MTHISTWDPEQEDQEFKASSGYRECSYTRACFKKTEGATQRDPYFPGLRCLNAGCDEKRGSTFDTSTFVCTHYGKHAPVRGRTYSIRIKSNEKIINKYKAKHVLP